MGKNKKLFFILLTLAFLTVAIAGCGQGEPADSEEKVVKIGFIGPLTGDVKTFGESTKNAFLLALEQVDYTVGDYKIEYFVEDDRNDVNEAVNVATKLVSQDGVQAIVGSVTSKTTIPVSQVANDAQVVQITSTATNAKVTVDEGQLKDYVFRACFIDPFQGLVGAKFAYDSLGAKTAAVLFDQGNDYTKGLAEVFKENFENLGGQVVAFEAYQKEDVDFSAVLTNIAMQQPDLLYLPDYYQKVSLIGKQAREKGITAAFLGGDGWDSSELDYATMDGGYFTNHYSPEDPRPVVQEWVELYQAKYGSVPDAFATLTYDATNLLLNAIATVNSNDPAAIKDAMKATSGFNAVSGNLSFDENNNPIKAAAILQIKDGKQVFVESVNP